MSGKLTVFMAGRARHWSVTIAWDSFVSMLPMFWFDSVVKYDVRCTNRLWL